MAVSGFSIDIQSIFDAKGILRNCIGSQKIMLEDILYLESDKNVVYIYTKKEFIRRYASLKNLQKALPPMYFVQTHKSFIINLVEIDDIIGNTIKTRNDKGEIVEVPISRGRKKEFMAAFEAYKGM